MTFCEILVVILCLLLFCVMTMAVAVMGAKDYPHDEDPWE